MNTVEYAFAGFGEPMIGWLLDASGHTSIIFAALASSCFAGAILAVGIRR